MARGDHIRTRRKGYWHHGIDCGDGTVIHYTGTPFRWHEAVVERCTMEAFLQGRGVEIVVHQMMLDAEAIVQRAESRLGERRYHLVRCNCEHFATWCAAGREESRQVTRALKAIAVGGVVVMAGGVLAARELARRRAESGA